jgi:hypothetical protein
MRGTVERVVGTVDPQCVEALVVRGVWRRRSVGVDEVNAVIPAARLIVVDTPRGGGAGEAPRVGGRAVAAATAGKAGSAARFVGPLVRDAAALALVALSTAARFVQYVAVQSGRFVVGTSAAVRRTCVRADSLRSNVSDADRRRARRTSARPVRLSHCHKPRYHSAAARSIEEGSTSWGTDWGRPLPSRPRESA